MQLACRLRWTGHCGPVHGVASVPHREWQYLDPDRNAALSFVTSGMTQSGATVTATCTVHATGTHTYSVQAGALLGGQGSVIFQGTLSDEMSAVQTGILGTFERGDTGSFVQSSCTFDFGNQPGDIASNPSMGIAS